ncbi:YceI family protein [Polynucleobacter sphagniphilus]|jgi:polyisoprenoid-binding protein YceI|uniref:YceI family protein n=1 Tax=Polynucleobacter sphagniphilus TaxID=1743169 RepID=UPI0024758CEB|nr:YceI family protein [Polynucleobacter sphagniphilus]MDH6421904.1 polyisoprenoid-binding protein YceI [Polynucleobacter sphagniphilus]MDH6525492.1 polyisoprenoid-binding protein YceI [Polynucleobacter sphagniphilus]
MKNYFASTLRASVAIAATLFAIQVFAAQYSEIDIAKSKISFTSKLMGSNLSGSFGKFSGKVTFNPDEPEKAKASLAIDIASFTAGGEELQEEAKGKDWFNTKSFPTANFVSESVKNLGAGKLEIHGVLTMKGKSEPVLISAAYQVQGKQIIFDANFQLLRLQYALGSGSWSDTSAVANEVPVKVHLVLNQK